ncbi:endoplasmic oxidoreductin-1 [Dispira simplex]|nr:endoplasmic oxidoreductin-1 [Dispira simplex]
MARTTDDVPLSRRHRFRHLTLLTLVVPPLLAWVIWQYLPTGWFGYQSPAPWKRWWGVPEDDLCRLRESGAVDDLQCEYHSIERVNQQLTPLLRQLAQSKYFRYYKVNLHKQCPFWSSEGQCFLEDCMVEPADEKELPEELQNHAAHPDMDEIDFSPFGPGYQPFSKCDYADTDFCVIEDEFTASGEYVDLIKNPERFTGYAGESAHNIWRAIYEENCFDFPARLHSTLESQKENGAAKPDSMAAQLRQIYLVDECKEKRIFYRLISGLHASISTHLCYNFYNRTTQSWESNLDCFMSRVGNFPSRLQNIYFDYALLLRAVFKLSPYLRTIDYCSGNPEEKGWVQDKMNELLSVCLALPETFDEGEMFDGPDAVMLKEEFKDHFRNVTRIMDCVGCQKCRLWGKIQTRGIATALKVLFSYEGSSLGSVKLERGEVVTLFNAVNQLSKSIEAIQYFHQQYHDTQQTTSFLSTIW